MHFSFQHCFKEANKVAGLANYGGDYLADYTFHSTFEL